MTSPSEPLVQIQNNFTELFIMMPSTKITQMVPSIEERDCQSSRKEMPFNYFYHWTTGSNSGLIQRSPELKMRNVFKWHLFLNHWSKFKIVSQKHSSWCPLPKLHKWFCSAEKGVGRALDKKYLQMKSPEPLVQNHNNFTEMVLMLPST